VRDKYQINSERREIVLMIQIILLHIFLLQLQINIVASGFT